MKATETLHEQGQSLWLHNVTRDLRQSGTLERYIDELSVTALTSDPTIFDHAIKNSSAYDAAIRTKVREGGGNVHQLEKLPAGCRAGDNANAFVGGFRLWERRQDG